jgi:hypothetical protein
MMVREKMPLSASLLTLVPFTGQLCGLSVGRKPQAQGLVFAACPVG